MTTKNAAEIAANLERSDEALRAAQELLPRGFYDSIASRAYYAAFYAVTALLLTEDLQFSKHSGVIALVHQRFVKTGKLDRELGRGLNWLFDLRNVGDYGGPVHVGRQDAERALQTARSLLEAITPLVEERVKG